MKLRSQGDEASARGFGRRAGRGFTLIELLAVMVIMSLLIALATPAVLNSLGATSLSTAGDLVRNKLTQAQQEAIAKNAPVEVRFYYYEDRDYEGFGQRVRAFQMFQLTNVMDDPSTPEEDESIVRLSEPIYLEGGIVLSADSDFSTFRSPPPNPISPSFSGTDTEFEYCSRATPAGSATYWSFRFLPDGSTDLAGNDRWFWTALDDRMEEQVQAGGALPSNFYTIQLDALTGAARTFRPGE